MNIQKLKFPTGKYNPNKNPSSELITQWIKQIEDFPTSIEDLCRNISLEQLNWKYRPEGWTVKQLVHHCSDSHMNSFIRFKLALTEKSPTIKPYFEDRWATLADSLDENIEDSLSLLRGLHKKWVILLRSLNDEQLRMEYTHPEHGKKFNLAETIGNYAWHCKHHLAHIRNALASNGKYN